MDWKHLLAYIAGSVDEECCAQRTPGDGITGKANYRMMIQWTIRTIAPQIRSKATRKQIVSSRTKNDASALHALTERGVHLCYWEHT